MRTSSSFVMVASLALGGACLLASAHQAAAAPKVKGGQTTTTQDGRTLAISKEAGAALKALETAVKAKDEAAYPAALAAAQAAATTSNEKYFLGRFRLEHGLNVNDAAEQMVALETVIASGAATAAELPRFYQGIGILASNARNWQAAHDAFAKMVELSPDNSDAIVNLAMAKMKLHKESEALPLLERAIAAAKTAGKPVPESWYRNALKLAYEGQKPEAAALSREVWAVYPTAENWRNLLVIYQDSVRNDNDGNLDALRLMRASKAMSQKSEYYELAIALSDAGLPGEAKLVLDEAVAANIGRLTDDTYKRVMGRVATKVDDDRASLPQLEARAAGAPTGRLAFRTADALLGYGEYVRAAALYRTAIVKGGADVDVGLANMRLGIALALAGNKAEAESVFKGVRGPRASMAGFWLDWLARKR